MCGCRSVYYMNNISSIPILPIVVTQKSKAIFLSRPHTWSCFSALCTRTRYFFLWQTVSAPLQCPTKGTAAVANERCCMQCRIHSLVLSQVRFIPVAWTHRISIEILLSHRPGEPIVSARGKHETVVQFHTDNWATNGYYQRSNIFVYFLRRDVSKLHNICLSQPQVLQKGSGLGSLLTFMQL